MRADVWLAEILAGGISNSGLVCQVLFFPPSNIILQLLINRVVPGSAKSPATFNHFRIMLSMWIQCVPLLQALTLIHDEVTGGGECYSTDRLQHPQRLSRSLQPQCNSALNSTVQATVRSASDRRFRDHRRLNRPCFIQPAANLPQTVYSQRALLSGVCLWQPDSVPHLHVQSHERLASSDSSSQHPAPSPPYRSAFSPACGEQDHVWG